MKKNVFWGIALTMALASCSNEELATGENGQSTLKVVVETSVDSRVGFDKENDWAFFWHNSDKIWVNGKPMDTDAVDKSATAVFEGWDVNTTDGYAVYPYSIAKDKVSNNALTMNFPTSYEYKAWSGEFFKTTDEIPVIPMAAKVDQGTASFKHLGALFIIKFNGWDEVGNHVFTLTSSKQITGDFTADLTAEEPQFTATEGKSNNTVTISFTRSEGAENGDLVFYIPVPTGTYDVALSMQVDGKDKYQDEKSNFEVKRADFIYAEFEKSSLVGGADNVISSKATLKEALEEAVKAGETNIVLDAGGANIGDLNHGLTKALVPTGTTVTIKNAVVEGKSYGNGVEGTVIFENCTFANNGAYSIHFDNGNGNVVFNKCTLSGWSSFGSTIKSVKMTECKITGNGTYGLVRFYQTTTMTNCTIDVANANTTDNYPEGISAAGGAIVTMNGCTMSNGGYEYGEDGSYIVVEGVRLANNAETLTAALSNENGNVSLTGTVDMEGKTITVNKDTKISGGTIKNATLQVVDEGSASFEGVAFDAETTIQATGDGALSFKKCTFDVDPKKIDNNSRYSAIVGSNQNNTIDLNLEECTFNYTYNNEDEYNNAIFMWSSVKNVTIKNCKFNNYGFVTVKLMNVAEGANIVFENNEFKMSKKDEANYYYNCAIQIVPQHDNTVSVTLTNNKFTGDYQTGADLQKEFGFTVDNTNSIVCEIAGMNYGFGLTKLTFSQSGNTINGVNATENNFALKKEDAKE